VTFAAEAHQAQRQIRCTKSALNNLHTLEIRFGLRRPSASKKAGQYIAPLKTASKRYPGTASDHLTCVISNNLRRYCNCSLSDWKHDYDKKIQNCRWMWWSLQASEEM